MHGCWCQQKSFQSLWWTWVIPRPWWPTVWSWATKSWQSSYSQSAGWGLWQEKAARYMLDYLNSSLWNKPTELAEAEISTLCSPVALPAQHHLPVVLYGHSQHLPSARGNWVTPEPALGLSNRPTALTDGELDLVHLWVYICVNKNVSNKNDRLGHVKLQFSLPTG